MTFSPDSRHLAFTTLDPLRTDKPDLHAGQQTFRLMVIDEDKHLRILEETTDALLTSPGYSPDGQRVAYLRIPLLSADQDKKLGEEAEARLKPLENAMDKSWTQWWASSGAGKQSSTAEPSASQPADAAQTQPAATQPAIQIVDAALPPVTNVYPAIANTIFLPPAFTELVVRDSRTGQVISQTPVELPAVSYNATYMYTQPEFDGEGQWVYFTATHFAMAVNPTTNEKRVLAGKNLGGKLSPDSQTYAVLSPVDGSAESVIALISTDGQAALYRRLPFATSRLPVWIDDQTLALLADQPGATKTESSAAGIQPAGTQPAQAASLTIHRLRRDGTLLEPLQITLPKDLSANQASLAGIAIAPDGRHFVLAFPRVTLFGTIGSQTVSRWQSPNGISLTQPTFSPDSRRVAFKATREIAEKTLRTEAILFFSPEGSQHSRVEIPAARATTTYPAQTQP